MQAASSQNPLKTFGTLLITLFLIYYIPIDTIGTNAPIKTALMAMSIVILFIYNFYISKALLIGVLYLGIQYFVASFHPSSFRWGTIIYTALLVLTYVCFYNMVVIKRIFTIEYFIKICKWMMTIYFVVCIIQQFLITIGIAYFPTLNLFLILDRGIGCQSLSLEPSHFARIMLVFYYAYVKCCEYKRGEGPFTLNELLSGEHLWVTIRFLWMMTTMGSGTAFVCIILFSLYFVRRHNWYYVIPALALSYLLIQASGIEALDRATSTINATTTMNLETVENADGSAAYRIAPLINSLNADFTKTETWLGYGIDYAVNNQMHTKHSMTLFDDYGFIFYLVTLALSFTCAYNFLSLATIFMFAGVGGGCHSNVQYTWALMMVMTCVKYFYENRHDPEIYENEEKCEESDKENVEEELETAVK